MQAVKHQPKNVQAWNVLGLCHTSMGDIGDGIAAYKKAIELQPDHREAWANLAQARKEVWVLQAASAMPQFGHGQFASLCMQRSVPLRHKFVLLSVVHAA